MELDILARMIGSFLVILGGILLYFSIADEEKLRSRKKRKKASGANFKLIAVSTLMILIGLVLIITGGW